MTIHIRMFNSRIVFGLLLPGLAACGGDGGTSPNPQPQNGKPIATATASPMAVPQGDGNMTVVTLDGSGSTDPDGDPLTFSWTVPSGTFVNGTTASSAIPQVTFPGAAPYNVSLIVSDGRGLADTAMVLVDLIVNTPPMAVVTANPTMVPLNDGNTTVVTIDGTGSSDPDGDTITFQWNVPSGTFVQGTVATDPIIKVTFPGVADYTVTLTVDDGRGGSAQASVTIQVQ